MKKITRVLRDIPPLYMFSTLIILVTIFSFLYLQPTIRSTWDTKYRSQLLTQFIAQIQKEGKVDPQTFWLFRERYSAGSMQINTAAVDMFQTYRASHLTSDPTTLLMEYKSPLLKSEDIIITSLKTFDKMRQNLSHDQRVVIAGDSFFVIEDSNKNSTIVFIATIDEMKKANGFFDYVPQENELLKNTWWLSITNLRKEY